MKKTILLALVAGLATFARADENPPWATCACDEPAIVPVGTSWAGGELSFTNRAANGGASFDFAVLDAMAFATKTIRFADGEIKVDSLRFDPAFSLRFVGGVNTVLKGIADKSIFDGIGPELPASLHPDPTVWSNLTFTCDAAVRPVWRNGGAIAICDGGFTVVDCAFANCFCEEFGGAIYAPLLRVDSVVTNCTFAESWVSAYNGYGGAIYVSAATAGRTLSIFDSAFSRNEAENGGAICTVRAADDNEKPIGLKIRSSLFSENLADYGGGAIFAEGAVSVGSSGGRDVTVFTNNVAGISGGAIAINGVEGEGEGFFRPTTLTVGEGVVFVDNLVTNAATWTSGGAIAVMPQNCTCSVYKVAFIRNDARGNSSGYGAAISLSDGVGLIDTCVFDCARRTDDAIYGGAVDFDGGRALIRNSTFRHASVEAISSLNAQLTISNVVAVGNGTCGGGYTDIYCDGTDLSISYSAYGTLSSDTTLAVDDHNLAGRDAADVYADTGTLRLKATGFNPVAGLGLVQAATDFDGVTYGSKACGYSMGAYETPTEPLLVTLNGDKIYDETTASNGCTWTWRLSTTNFVTTTWDDLGDPKLAFTIASWAFGDSDVGYYASTNAAATAQIAAALSGAEDLRPVLVFLYTGNIFQQKTDGLDFILPDEYAWTGFEIAPTNDVFVTNIATRTGLVLGIDYELRFENNIDVTDSARAIVTGIGNYSGVLTNLFYITAYFVEYYLDGVQDGPADQFGSLSGSNVCAAIDVPEGYALDYQGEIHKNHSITNGVVTRYGSHVADACHYENGLLVLRVYYEIDENDDDVPDKYQKKMVFAVVNGWWNGERNGKDKLGYVTLYDANGDWSATGTGSLSTVDIGIPTAGQKPFGQFTEGAWTAVLPETVTADAFPLLLYAYAHDAEPKPRTRLTLSAAANADYVPALVITQFAADGDRAVEGAVQAEIVETATGRSLASTSLDGVTVRVLGAETLEGPWKVVSEQRTGENGRWAVERIRTAKFFKIVEAFE